MDGIKSHTHEERTRLIERLIPAIQQQFGTALVAIAADGSYARNEDRPYSDLELVVFVDTLQSAGSWKFRHIIDGQLIVAIAETRDSFIAKYLDVSDVWYASGAGKLLPIVNESFIAGINAFRPDDVAAKCRRQATARWPMFQEITAKVLNIADTGDPEGLALTVPQMVKELLVILSYLNATPYVTLGSYIRQAMSFPVKPDAFTRITSLYTDGNFRDASAIGKAARDVFSQTEQLMRDTGADPYGDSPVL